MFNRNTSKPINIGEGKFGVHVIYNDGRRSEIHWMPTAKSRDGLLEVFRVENDVKSVSSKKR